MDLYRRLKPKELLTFFGELYQTPTNELSARVDYLMKAFDINDFADRHCEKLSTGQKQRVGIARTLVHNPAVVVLDEPTTGLDIMASEFVLRFIQKTAKKDNKTVLFSTHNLTEVERLCDRIGIVDRGRLVYLGTVADLLAKTGHQTLAESFFALVGGSTAMQM
jgi:sodium transport system ATP-binding protein